MANANKQSKSNQAKPKKHVASNNTAQRKLQLAKDGERPSKHNCANCGDNILVKDLQIVVVGKPGGHSVKEPHHKKCCFQFK